jgi:hypothetical protein
VFGPDANEPIGGIVMALAVTSLAWLVTGAAVSAFGRVRRWASSKA